MLWLSVVFGTAVGFALGLTGGGGSLLAVPMLIYGLGLDPREAFGISLAAVGTTALAGVIPRISAGEVELGTGLMFALAGMAGAPLGTWTARMIPEVALLTLFAVLMLAVAARMWATSTAESLGRTEIACKIADHPPTCRRMTDGTLTWTSRCAALLVLVGVATGFLSGMFGIGGGFVIVPALVLFSGMSIRRAIATSLLVIVLVSISGVGSHFIAGRGISIGTTALFASGGVLGMFPAVMISKRLPPAALQRLFSGGIALVAIFVAIKTLA